MSIAHWTPKKIPKEKKLVCVHIISWVTEFGLDIISIDDNLLHYIYIE